MKPLKFLLLLILTGCAHLNKSDPPREGKRSFVYLDVTGKWSLAREFKTVKTKLVTRSIINESHGSLGKPLEKSVTVSQLGSVKSKKGGRISVVRPYASEYSIWLDGKEYRSRLSLDHKKRALVAELNSPEARWNGQSTHSFPKGKYFCFFSQLPECLYYNHLLTRAQDRKGMPQALYIVWDSWPYGQEQLTGVGSTLFSPTTLTFEKVTKGIHHFLVEVNGQTLLYQFSKSNDLVRMFWIAQGISVLPPGEELQQDVE